MKKPLGWLSLFLIAILPLSGFAEVTAPEHIFTNPSLEANLQCP